MPRVILPAALSATALLMILSGCSSAPATGRPAPRPPEQSTIAGDGKSALLSLDALEALGWSRTEMGFGVVNFRKDPCSVSLLNSAFPSSGSSENDDYLTSAYITGMLGTSEWEATTELNWRIRDSDATVVATVAVVNSSAGQQVLAARALDDLGVVLSASVFCEGAQDAEAVMTEVVLPSAIVEML